jgi:type I restriction enzyme M protein
MRSWEAIVSNPPYSIRWEGSDNPILASDERFTPAGVLAPKGKADFAFIMHCVASLAEKGVAAIVCFPGIFYRGGAEQKIRKYLVDENLIDCIIQLPENLFFGTSIATNILVLSKSKIDDTITFIDASHECVKVTNSNKLTEENIQTILGWATKRPTEDDDANVAHRVHHVPAREIRDNKYDLTVSTYVEPEDTRPKIDIAKLNQEISDIVAEEDRLRKEIDRILGKIDLSKISAYRKDKKDRTDDARIEEATNVPSDTDDGSDVPDDSPTPQMRLM